MNEIFMKILFLLSDNGNVRDITFYKNGGYGSIDIEIDGKSYCISIRETEDEKND